MLKFCLKTVAALCWPLIGEEVALVDTLLWAWQQSRGCAKGFGGTLGGTFHGGG